MRSTAVLSLLTILVSAQTSIAVPTHQWTQRYGGASADEGTSVAFDPSGNVLVAGTSNHYAFVAKYDANGSQLWFKSLGEGQAYDVAADPSGNVLVTGGLGIYPEEAANPQTSILVVKFDPAGTQLWIKTFGTPGGTYDEGIAIAADASGNVAVTGRFLSTVNFGGGPLTSAGSDDIFIAKFASDGTHVWSRRAGSATYREYGSGISFDGSGNVVVIGTNHGPVDMGGGALPFGGALDMFLAKYASNGAHVWSHSYGAIDFDDGSEVACGASDNVFLLGRFGGTVNFGGGNLVSAGEGDVVLAKYDASGTHQWSKRFGTTGYTSGYGVTVDPIDNVVIAGAFPGTVDFGGGALVNSEPSTSEIFVAKFNTDGDHLWSSSFGDIGSDAAENVATNIAGDIAIAGYFGGSVDFGGGDVTSAGNVDMFVTKFLADALVAVPVVPLQSVVLGQNHPNPFNPTTTIEYSVREHSPVVIGIYDARGARVTRLDEGVRELGTHRVQWDGRNSVGQVVASGTYFYRLEGSGAPARKMVLLK